MELRALKFGNRTSAFIQRELKGTKTIRRRTPQGNQNGIQREQTLPLTQPWWWQTISKRNPNRIDKRPSKNPNGPRMDPKEAQLAIQRNPNGTRWEPEGSIKESKGNPKGTSQEPRRNSNPPTVGSQDPQMGPHVVLLGSR